jgi:hypothetical protein
MAHKWDPICARPRGLVRPTRLVPTGLTGPTRGQSRGTRWRSPAYGWNVPSSIDDTLPEQRILEQSVRMPPGGAVTGWGSLRLCGGAFFDGLAPDCRTRLPVPLAVGQHAKLRGDHRVTLSREPLDAREVELLHGIRCTTVDRALFDEMRRTRDLREAVVAMDMAAAALLVSVARMRRYLDGHRS